MMNLKAVPETEACLTLLVVCFCVDLPVWHYLCPVNKMISADMAVSTFLLLFFELSPHFGNKPLCHYFHEFMESEFLCTLLQVQNVSIHKCKIQEVEKHFLPPLH
jgi:hypothetical protein